jgi:hypothetical protein
MAEALILEFEGFGKDRYDAVNATLGLDPLTGEGDSPAGLISHAGAAKPGGWVVFEIWDSKESQESFMNNRLGGALAQAGIEGPPARVEWLELGGYHTH